MLKIFDENCIEIFKAEDGFVAAFTDMSDEEKPRMFFKYVSVKSDTSREIAGEYYKLLKFGYEYEEMKIPIDNFLFSLCRPLGKNLTVFVSSKGEGKIISRQGTVIAESDMTYGDTAPADIAVGKNAVWASYPQKKAVIRFNGGTLRQELRIGGEESQVFATPKGLLCTQNGLLICDTAKHTVINLDTSNFTVSEAYKFDEPIYQIINVDKFTVVRLKSGVYRI